MFLPRALTLQSTEAASGELETLVVPAQTHYSPTSSFPGHLSFFSLFLSSHAQCNKNKVKAT